MKVFKNSAPFIIWTLQRTGGTNLAKQLFERSGLLEELRRAARVENAPSWLGEIDNQWKLHEPFNMGNDARIFGKLTEQWIASKDKRALEQGVGTICAQRIPMKHCVEMVPWEVSAALAKMSVLHGYRHLFLLRDKSSSRLLSLHFAKMSGVWGKQFLGNRERKEKIFKDPLPVSELIAHETKCLELLVQAWRMLHSLDANPIAVRFEDIYEAADKEAGTQAVLSVLEFLDLTEQGEGNRKFASDLMEFGEQGTRTEYGNFSGVQDLESALKQMKRPAFVNRVYPVEVHTECAQMPQIVHAALDIHPKAIHPGLGFDVGGVLVVKEALLEQSGIYALTDSGERRVLWGIPSPAVAKMYANSANSASARFKLNGMKCKAGSSVDFILRYGSGASLPLFRLDVANNALHPANRKTSSC